MIDFDKLLLRPTYATFGKPATLTTKSGTTHSLRIIDQTDGAEIDVGEGVYGLVVGASVIASDIAGLDVYGAELVIDGVRWLVRTQHAQPIDGRNSGEILLELQEI